MTIDRINELVTLLPDDLYDSGPSSFNETAIQFSSNRELEVTKRINAFKDLKFLWTIIDYYVKRNLPLPFTFNLSNEDEALAFQLHHYLMQKDRQSEYYKRSYIFETLLGLQSDDMRMARAALDAALVVRDTTIDEIAVAFGLNALVVDAYEKIFFNVIDRRNELLFQANIVYPDTRFSENRVGYTEDEDYRALLKRSAFNNGLDELLYFLGIKSGNEIVSQGSSLETATKLEDALMQAGVILARNGYMNQGSRIAPSISRPTGMISAAKQSGTGPSTGSPFSSMGAVIMKELNSAVTTTIQNQKELQGG